MKMQLLSGILSGSKPMPIPNSSIPTSQVSKPLNLNLHPMDQHPTEQDDLNGEPIYMGF